MANAKSIELRGELPFNWFDHPDHGGKLTLDDQSFIGRCLLGQDGLTLTWIAHMERYVPNPDGSNGKTAMNLYHISGIEAMSYPAIDRLCDLIAQCGGTVDEKYVDDLEG